MQSTFLAAVQAKQKIFSCASSSINLVAQLVAHTGLIADLLSLFISLLSIWLYNRKQQNTSSIKGGKKINVWFHISEVRSMSYTAFLSYMYVTYLKSFPTSEA